MNEMTAAEFFAAPSQITWTPPSQGLMLRDKTRIDVSGDVWTAPTPTRTWTIDFRKLDLAMGDDVTP